MSNLEQILELLLAEDTEKAEELLHEYVVAKARAEYERVLDESDEVEEDIHRDSKSKDFEKEITDDEEEIHQDTVEAEEDDEESVDLDDMDMDADADADSMDMDMDADADADADADEDIEDKVEDMEADLEDLRRELESLISAQDGDMDDMDMDVDADSMDMDMDMDADDDMEDEMMDSVEYDLDEMEDLEEATALQDKVPEPKGGAGDAEGESPFTKAPKHSSVSSQGSPVKAKDGSEGKKNHGAEAKEQDPTDNNIDVDHKKAPAAKDGKSNADGSNSKSPLSKRPK
jgi:hypothetical protein